jgi:hypothetical protein
MSTDTVHNNATITQLETSNDKQNYARPAFYINRVTDIFPLSLYSPKSICTHKKSPAILIRHSFYWPGSRIWRWQGAWSPAFWPETGSHSRYPPPAQTNNIRINIVMILYYTNITVWLGNIHNSVYPVQQNHICLRSMKRRQPCRKIIFGNNYIKYEKGVRLKKYLPK